MPIYEYVCKSCGEKTELIQRFADKPLVVCPHCGKRALKKAFSAPAIQFKGSGWYVTDYARSKESKEARSRSEKADKGEKSDKGDKADKSESPKSEKSASDEKAGKSEKVDKADKSDKSDKKKSKDLTVSPQRISVR